MELKEINYDEYIKFALNNEYISIYQLPEWGDLKKTTGWNKYLLGLFNQNELVGVTLLLEKDTPIKKSLFYAPRGFLTDTYCQEVINGFTNEIKKFIKNHNGFMLKIDPNVIYALYDSNGNNIRLVNDSLIDSFKNNGYKHLGFTKNFETLQPRYLCRFKLQDNYEDTLGTFDKSVRKNILKLDDYGVFVRKINVNEIDCFVNILNESANVNEFVVRPVWYYKKMYELLSDYIRLYITYIDPTVYLEKQMLLKNELSKELSKLQENKNKINVGKKVALEEDRLVNQLKKIDENIKEAQEMAKEHKRIDIGALMSLFIGNEAITFMSGTIHKYRKFNPKFAYYNQHIIDAINAKKEYCNFYGISGNMKKDSKYYNIYEIKKGFNPEIVELVGEFDLITSKFWYLVYKIALKFYKLLKKVKK